MMELNFRMTNAINNNMITLARESRGVTQKELSLEVPGLSQGNLSRMEKGLLSVPENIIKDISEYLGYPISFFKQDGVKTPISSFYYRKRVSISKKSLNKLEAILDIYRLAVDELLESIDMREPLFPKLDAAICTPEEAARKTREVMRIPRGPVQNLIGVLESNGILVIELVTETEKFDGITLYTDSGQPIIFINKEMPNDRKRFTIGHELGHLVMHIPFILRNNQDEDIEANKFSSEFNMPELDCINDLVNLKYNVLGTLKSYWKLSKSAIVRRAYDLDVITQQRYTYFNIELSRRGERKKETGTVDLPEPVLLKKIIKAHIDELGYSVEELSKIIHLSVEDYTDYFAEKPLLRVVKRSPKISIN